jgi:hypothetical protein
MPQPEMGNAGPIPGMDMGMNMGITGSPVEEGQSISPIMGGMEVMPQIPQLQPMPMPRPMPMNPGMGMGGMMGGQNPNSMKPLMPKPIMKNATGLGGMMGGMMGGMKKPMGQPNKPMGMMNRFANGMKLKSKNRY